MGNRKLTYPTWNTIIPRKKEYYKLEQHWTMNFENQIFRRRRKKCEWFQTKNDWSLRIQYENNWIT